MTDKITDDNITRLDDRRPQIIQFPAGPPVYEDGGGYRWQPTNREVLEGHYKPEGSPCWDPKLCQPLGLDGLLEPFITAVSGHDVIMYYKITERGEHAVEFMRRERREPDHRLPDWVLAEASK